MSDKLKKEEACRKILVLFEEKSRVLVGDIMALPEINKGIIFELMERDMIGQESKCGLLYLFLREEGYKELKKNLFS